MNDAEISPSLILHIFLKCEQQYLKPSLLTEPDQYLKHQHNDGKLHTQQLELVIKCNALVCAARREKQHEQQEADFSEKSDKWLKYSMFIKCFPPAHLTSA